MKKIIRKLIVHLFPELKKILNEYGHLKYFKSYAVNCKINKELIHKPYHLNNVSIGAYSYIGSNSNISNTQIGKFCSIGPNFIAGYGLHPTNGISTSPMFYSASNLSTGITLCKETKFQEHKPIKIGHDVFIGANVIIFDGVTIGNGAVIGAGAVVNKNIPAYAIVGGVPAKVLKYRFANEKIVALEKIKWWDFEGDKLKDVERMYFNIDEFIKNYYNV